MKTVIKQLNFKNKLFVIILFMVKFSFSQENRSVYLMFNDDMIISEFGDEVTLKFTLNSHDSKPNTYNFKIHNLVEGFKLAKFNEIKNPILLDSINKKELFSLNDLSDMKPCKLHYFLSDVKTVYLIKELEEKYFKYSLIYWSTQRGWAPVNTN